MTVAAPPIAASTLATEPGSGAPTSPTAWTNIRLMHALERIAQRFADEGLSLMVLKGAALHLGLGHSPETRPMCDLDVLVRPEELEKAMAVFESMGCLRSPEMFREDFFPAYYYEMQVALGSIRPITIDLHVRPLRPLRYAQQMPDDAFWVDAIEAPIGSTNVAVPSPEVMLVHLLAHRAVHGNTDSRWREDIRQWIEHAKIDWSRFVDLVEQWGLAWPVRQALAAAECAERLPADIRVRLDACRVGWRDRLVLWHAPRDRAHLTRSALVNLLTTRGLRFRLGYAKAVCVPDREYLTEWCVRHRWPWRPAAFAARLAWPVIGRLAWIRTGLARIEIKPSPIHGHGVFATKSFEAGDAIARYRGQAIDRDNVYTAYDDPNAEGDAAGQHEITGRLRFLNHCCRPNAELRQRTLVALRSIRDGDEITIDYGEGTCRCRERAEGEPTS